MLSTFMETATDPRLITFVAVGLLGSVLIAVWPALKKFSESPSYHLRQLPRQALAVVREPAADAASPEASPSTPRAVLLFGAVGVVLAAWTGYAFTQPAYETRTVQATRWENVSAFGFTGHGPRSNALPDGATAPVSAETIARTGGPPALFSNVLTSLDFAYTYGMRSDQKIEVLGSGGAALRIKAQDGWERTITLLEPQPLISSDVTLWFPLNLDAARLVIAGVEMETGSRSEWYDFTVVPMVRVIGQQGETHIDETYATEYHLRYDRVRITPDTTMERIEPATGPLRQESERQLRALGLSMSFGLSRWLAGVVAIAALARAVMLVPSKPSRPAPAPKAAKPRPTPAAVRAAPPVKVAATPASAANPTAAAPEPTPLASPRATTDSALPAISPSPLAARTPPRIATRGAGTFASHAPAAPAAVDPPAAAVVEPAEPTAADVLPSATPPMAPAPVARTGAEPRPSPETLRAAIQRNLAASAEMAALLAESVRAASNGGGHLSNGHKGEEPAADESPAA